MLIERCGKIYNIQPSLYLCRSITPFFLNKILNVAIDQKAPFHIWFHPWNLGSTNMEIEKYLKNVFSPFLNYAKTKERRLY